VNPLHRSEAQPHSAPTLAETDAAADVPDAPAPVSVPADADPTQSTQGSPED
jgi:hypothetical protein